MYVDLACRRYRAAAAALTTTTTTSTLIHLLVLLFPRTDSDRSSSLYSNTSHHNSVVEQKYKKNGKFQLVSQWVFSMSFKITKVKLLFLGWFYVLFVHLLRKWRIPNFPRSSGGKHDKNDKKKSHFPFTLLLAILGGYGGLWWAKRLGFNGLWH